MTPLSYTVPYSLFNLVGGFREADTDNVREDTELRDQVARSLQGHAEAIVSDALAVYPFAGVEHVKAEDRGRLAECVFQLIVSAVREAAPESDHPLVTTVRQIADDNQVRIRDLFTIMHLTERSALDQLALDESFGVESEPWPTLVQLVRRASLDACAALSECISDVAAGRMHDLRTTLHTRAVFLAALEKEIQRSERFGNPFAVIVIDVDRLEDINARYGRGAGDRVLERTAILVKNYFRETDWVARSSDDAFAVLLPEIPGTDAARLAERIRVTIGKRLELHDYRSDQPFPVTVSVGVLVAESIGRTAQADQLLADAEAAVSRARQAGGNRVVRIDAVASDASTPSRDTIQID